MSAENLTFNFTQSRYKVPTNTVNVLYCSRIPAAKAPMHCSRKLIAQTLVFSRSYLQRQMSPPETLVVKGGTTWARNGQWILPENARLPRNVQGSFTCRKFTTWDRLLYFPSEGRRAEDFFALKYLDGFGRVWTPRTWVPKASTLPQDHQSRLSVCYLFYYGNIFRFNSSIFRPLI